MSPLLGSAGGSSEYAFRGTLDDWPNAFATVLSAQNLTGRTPGTAVTATLTVGGINYKARLTIDNPNTTVSINGGSPVNAKQSDPKVFVRDNDVITINFQIPLVDVLSFSKTYTINVKIGKRTGVWTVGTRAIDATPNIFSFINQPNLELSTLVTSNTVTISGLEPNFNFDLSVGAGVTYYKNGVISTSSTITNGDTLYLETISPSTFSTLRSYTVSAGGISALGIVGGISTTWTITTRVGDGVPDAFTFTDVLQANDLGGIYTSNPITISGVDAGPLDPDPLADITAVSVGINAAAVSIGGGYEIRDSFGNLRYNSVPPGSEYFQNNVIGTYSATNYAYLGDTIRVRLNSSPNYSTTRNITLDLNGVSDTYSVTTRPTSINSIPSTTGFDFPALNGLNAQNRGSDIFSNTITLSGMTSGDFGSASITAATAGINPRFRVVRGGVEVKSYTAAEPFNVQNADQITLRMTTPNPADSDGVTTSTMTFAVSGTNTQLDDADRDGFTTTSGSTSATWSVTTKARSCGPINTFSFTNLTGVNAVNPNFDVVRTFTPSGFEIDCAHTAILSSNSSNYNFTGKGSPIVAIGATKRLNNIVPGEPIEVTVRSSGTYSSPDIGFISRVTTNVSITNTEALNPATPDRFYTSPDWLIDTVGDNTAASASISSNLTEQEVSQNVTLSWTSTNVIAFRSASWTTATLALAGDSTTSMPAAVPPAPGTFRFTISFYANSTASNYSTLPQDTADPGLRRYVQASVDVTVLNDLTASITNFTNVTVPCSNDGGVGRVISNSITISGITGTITGSIPDGEKIVGGGTQSSLNTGAFSNTDKTISNSNTIRLEIPNNTNFLNGTIASTSTGTINFSNGNGARTFTVTSSACVSGEQNEIDPATGANIITATINSRNANILVASATAVDQALTQYVTKLPTGTGTYTGWVTAAGPAGQRFDGSTSDITWTQAFEALFKVFNNPYWRISTDTVTTTPGFRRNPYLSEVISPTGYLIRLNSALLSGAGFRDPLVNPITNVTQWIDYFISINVAPTDAQRVKAFSMVSRTTGLSSTGYVFDFCRNPIPLVYPISPIILEP